MRAFLSLKIIFEKETLEKIVRLDRNVERKIICLMNSDLSDRISKKRIRIKAGKATS